MGSMRVTDEDPLKPSFFGGVHMLKPYPDHDSSIGGVSCIFFDCFEESCDVWVLPFGFLSTVKTEIRRHFMQTHKSYSNSTQRSHHFLFDQKKNHIIVYSLWISLIVFDICPNVNLRPPDLKTGISVMLEMTGESSVIYYPVVFCNLSFQGMIPRGCFQHQALQENHRKTTIHLAFDFPNKETIRIRDHISTTGCFKPRSHQNSVFETAICQVGAALEELLDRAGGGQGVSSRGTGDRCLTRFVQDIQDTGIQPRTIS